MKNFKSNFRLSILEVGANRGEHLSNVAGDFEKYVLTHLNSYYQEIESANSNISFTRCYMEILPFQDSSFDRVASTYVFQHVANPELGFREIGRVMKIGGKATVFFLTILVIATDCFVELQP